MQQAIKTIVGKYRSNCPPFFVAHSNIFLYSSQLRCIFIVTELIVSLALLLQLVIICTRHYIKLFVVRLSRLDFRRISTMIACCKATDFTAALHRTHLLLSTGSDLSWFLPWTEVTDNPYRGWRATQTLHVLAVTAPPGSTRPEKASEADLEITCFKQNQMLIS